MRLRGIASISASASASASTSRNSHVTQEASLEIALDYALSRNDEEQPVDSTQLYYLQSNSAGSRWSDPSPGSGRPLGNGHSKQHVPTVPTSNGIQKRFSRSGRVLRRTSKSEKWTIFSIIILFKQKLRQLHRQIQFEYYLDIFLVNGYINENKKMLYKKQNIKIFIRQSFTESNEEKQLKTALRI